MAAPSSNTGDVSEAQAYCIFVCGATAPKDLRIFADFMATSKIFIKTGGINGIYINTWPVDEYMKENTSVTWGHEGPNVGTPLVVYNRGETAWWQQVPPLAQKNVPEMVLKELENISQTARIHDTVTIFFFGHSSERAWLEIGNGHELSRTALDEVVARDFTNGVQINIVVAACSSGKILEMIRNPIERRRTVQVSAAAIEKTCSNAAVSTSIHWRRPPVIAAYASSLISGLKTAQKTNPKSTLEQHIHYVNYQEASTDDSDLSYLQNRKTGDTHGVLDAVLNLFLHSYVTHSLRGGEKVEYEYFTPSNPGPELKPQEHSAAAELAFACSGGHLADKIESEVQRIRRRPGETVEEACSNNDKAFFTYRYQLKKSKDPRELLDLFKDLLSGLRWRLRLQEQFMFVLDEFLRDELISESALARPMDIARENPAVDDMVQLLEVFDTGAICGALAGRYDELCDKFGHGHFEMPIRWLAMLILRSHPETELAHILARFHTTNLFGKFNNEFLAYVEPFCIQDMPTANEAQNAYDAGAYELGFLLPHGTSDLKMWAAETELRYQHIRDIYEDLHGEGTWGDASKFFELLELYKTHSLEDIMGPRWRRAETYLDNLSPVSGSSPFVFSGASSATMAASSESMSK
ncbi:hypothetical protein EKO04_006029 [Ascochyta lentis]|uniref:Uncharacterized protein n=1 Tax=Ascochyta lentis TaxID=205686 RepID=A0A8H7J3E8_9PLEO|nr:hypothetical protein EKO04_006029 [Ascochyta lentis]